MCSVKVSLKRFTSSFLIPLMLASCGAGEGDTNSFDTLPDIPNIAVEALNGIAAATLNSPTTIDVAPFIYGDKDNIEIEVMNAARQDCPNPISSGLTFKITAKALATCHYQYDIKQKKDNKVISTGQMQVLVTKNQGDAYLEPLSAAIKINESVTFNFSSLNQFVEIAQIIIDGYEIKEDTVVVHSTTQSKLGLVDVTIQPVWAPIIGSVNYPVITFHASNQPGWNYISFIATNSNLGEEKFGYIFITISDDVNQAPVITEQNFQHDDISVNTKTTISLKDLKVNEKPLISDEDEWFLDSVMSMNADVQIVSKDAFTFQSSAKDTTHYVTYMVRDEHNAYSLGTIEIEVTSSYRDWQDLVIKASDTQESLRFTAPLTNHELKKINRSQLLVEELTENNRFEVAAWTLAEAQEYCGAQGYQLPDKKTFSLLLNKDTHLKSNWPDDIGYWVYDNDTGTYRTMMLEANAKTSAIKDDSFAYLTCVDYYSTLATNN